jgi:hypothetical protein
VDEVGVVHWEDCAAAVSAAVAAEVDVDLEGDADVEGAVVKRYLLKILMQIWRSIIQKLCR